MALNKTWRDAIVAAMIGAVASALVAIALETIQGFSLPQRIFYMETRRPPAAESAGKHVSIIELINPSDEPIVNFSLSLTSRNRTDPQIVDQYGDTDFGNQGTPPQISYSNGVVNLRFGRLPEQARYMLVVHSSDQFEIGSDPERARAYSQEGRLRLLKLKLGYYRFSPFENWYFLIAGLLAGPVALLAYQRLKRRHSVH
jgi:hypothetical protein